MRSPDYPAHEAGAIMEALTGARLDHLRAYELGPERAGAVHFAKSIVVLSSMLGARHGLAIGIAGILDDLRAPGGARDANGDDPRPAGSACAASSPSRATGAGAAYAAPAPR